MQQVASINPAVPVTRASDDESLAAPQEMGRATLQGNHLSLWQVSAFGLAAMQLGPGIGYSAAYLEQIAGSAGWLCLCVALVGSFAIAYCVAAHARRYVVSGSLMSYASFSLGDPGRLIAGAALLVGYVLAMTSNTTIVAMFWTGTMVDLGIPGFESKPIQLSIVILATAYASLLAYRGIDASVRMSLILGFGCVPIVIAVLCAGLAHEGFSMGSQLDFSSFTPDSMIDGTAAAFGFYVGFDGITSLAAETKDPKRSVPHILYICLILLGALLVSTCILEAPFIHAHKADLDLGVSPLALVGRAGRVPMLSTLGDALITLSCIASTIAFANYGARVIATAAHDGLLPMWMAKIHVQHQSPHVAVIVLGVLAAALPAAVALPFHTSPIELTTDMTNMMVYIWLVPYTVICAGAVRLQLKEGSWSPLGLLCGAIGALGCIFLMAHSVHTSRGPTKALATSAYSLMAFMMAFCWWMSRRTNRLAKVVAHTPAE